MGSNIRPLSPALCKISIEQLNEDPNKIDERIQELREWIELQPHLKARTADQFLLAFLRGCKYDMELSKKKVDKFYSLRTQHPDLFFCTDIDEPKISEIKSLGVVLYPLTPINEDGPRLVLIRAGKYPTKKFSFANIVQFEELIQEISLWEDDNAIISGMIYIWDFADASYGHYFQITPELMKNVTNFVQKALPIRIKHTHFINTPRRFETFFNIIKRLLSQERQQKIQVHTHLETLYEIVPQQYLPVEYGGENGTVQEITNYWIEKIDSYREYFAENALYKTDESLRIRLSNQPDQEHGEDEEIVLDNLDHLQGMNEEESDLDEKNEPDLDEKK